MELTDDDRDRSERIDDEDLGEREQEEEEEEEAEEEDDSFDSDDSLDEPQEIPQNFPRLNAVYNSVALHEKLEEMGWPDGIDWIQTLGVSYDQPGEVDVDDDLAREMAFYTQALEGTREAYTKLQELGLPFLRPEDYYAEMVKSDTHMLKIKGKLLAQQKQYEEADVRRKSREAKRFAKEVQAEKLKERAQQKKQNIDSVKKWRKMRQKQGFIPGEGEFPVGFEDEEPSSNKKRRLNSAYGDRRGGNSGEGLPRSKEGEADGQRLLGKASGSGGAFKGNVAPWDRSGAKNRGSFTGNKGEEPSSNKKRRLNPAYGDRRGGSPGEGLPRSMAGEAVGQRLLGKVSGLGRAFKGNVAPWDRSGGKNRGSFTRNKGGSKGGKAPRDGTGDKFDRSPGNFKFSKGRKGEGAKSRNLRNAKYGYGGKKGFKKQNTAESSAAGGGYKGRFKGNRRTRSKG